jgi:hypothetical protein
MAGGIKTMKYVVIHEKTGPATVATHRIFRVATGRTLDETKQRMSEAIEGTSDCFEPTATLCRNRQRRLNTLRSPVKRFPQIVNSDAFALYGRRREAMSLTSGGSRS